MDPMSAQVTKQSHTTDDKPDTSTLKAFFCTVDQGVNYHAGVWRESCRRFHLEPIV